MWVYMGRHLDPVHKVNVHSICMSTSHTEEKHIRKTLPFNQLGYVKGRERIGVGEEHRMTFQASILWIFYEAVGSLT